MFQTNKQTNPYTVPKDFQNITIKCYSPWSSEVFGALGAEDVEELLEIDVGGSLHEAIDVARNDIAEVSIVSKYEISKTEIGKGIQFWFKILYFQDEMRKS